MTDQQESAAATRCLSMGERLLSIAMRLLPIKHGKHRLLDRICPKPWSRKQGLVVVAYRGVNVMIDAEDLVGWHFAILRSFDPEVVEVLVRAASPNVDHTFWDIGANRGTCSYAMARLLPNLKIVAIEPQSSLRSNNESNLARVCPGRFEYYQVGVGESDEVLRLTIPAGNAGKATLHSVATDASDRYESVRIVEAAHVAQQSRYGWPTLVKIDVEGHEPHVIRSLSPALETRRCKAVVFENHFQATTQFESIRELAVRFGYSLFAIRKALFSTQLVRTSSTQPGVKDYVMAASDLLDEAPCFGAMVRG